VQTGQNWKENTPALDFAEIHHQPLTRLLVVVVVVVVVEGGQRCSLRLIATEGR
jgi:hypothetical protein